MLNVIVYKVILKCAVRQGVVLLSVLTLRLIMLSVIMHNTILICVNRLSAVLPIVIILNVVAPFWGLPTKTFFFEATRVNGL
jgi:hypothetical protein